MRILASFHLIQPFDSVRPKSIQWTRWAAPITGEDEAYRLYHGVYSRGSHHRSPEADVCGGEAPALPCLRAGCAHGGRGEWIGGEIQRQEGEFNTPQKKEILILKDTYHFLEL
jgi:hypothetical protein